MSQTLPELTDATLTLENRVATLTLNRHDVRNALTGTALVDDIVATAAWVSTAGRSGAMKAVRKWRFRSTTVTL